MNTPTNTNILSNYDLDVLAGMQIVLLHAAERCIQLTESHYQALSFASKEYPLLVKQYGVKKAKEIVVNTVGKYVRHTEKLNISELLKTGERFHNQMEKLTDVGISSVNSEVKSGDALDAIIYDSNFVCRILAMLTNIRSQKGDRNVTPDIDLKIESTLKLFPMADHVSDRLMDKFHMN